MVRVFDHILIQWLIKLTSTIVENVANRLVRTPNIYSNVLELIFIDLSLPKTSDKKSTSSFSLKEKIARKEITSSNSTLFFSLDLIN